MRQQHSTSACGVLRPRPRQDMGALITPVASECGNGRFIKTRAGRRKKKRWVGSGSDGGEALKQQIRNGIPTWGK